ncbi:integral peroxisomal membrane peroxin-domain-containing protein [Protomyces lactucae-debilis]|uniref:Integral peroxisomal membrane peroxin-domain-containing protein n=1 Tax=Protomyces lactucae-debilis TaxID=2754530 RepID=A0A1Y2EQ13_PROLT|nr:integral peroxisomal membrane peroxin-domain-containing protein [Protomyces lactucae-debilis]ORY73681.1 integral peroxisomal membrane peroxin-domain-containing protein [Protomyces lactucae-debilis]
MNKQKDVDAPSLQEQVIASVLSSLVPAADQTDKRKGKGKGAQQSSDEPPPLDLIVLTRNFRQFSSRIGVFFKLQSGVAAIYTWQKPRETVSYGMIWTLLCLQPYLALALPFAAAVFGLLIPSFLQLHPPPPSNIPLPPDLDSWATSTGNAKHFGEKAEGRDFLINMRDIQNAMEDYVQAYDQIALVLTDYANFANEKKSSVTLVACCIGMLTALVLAAYVPVKFLALLSGWIVLLSGHKRFLPLLKHIQRMSASASEKVREQIAEKVEREYLDPERLPEKREVVVYEYCYKGNDAPGDKRVIYSGFSTIGNAGREDAFTTHNLDDVQPPPGFAFVQGSQWSREAADGKQPTFKATANKVAVEALQARSSKLAGKDRDDDARSSWTRSTLKRQVQRTLEPQKSV